MRPGRRTLAIAAAALGSAAAGGALVQRRQVRNRRAEGRAAGAGEVELGSLRSASVTITTDDGLRLHAEVDDLDENPAGSPVRGDSAALTLVFVHGYALNLDCWHFQRLHFRGSYRMVFYDQRSHGRSERSDKDHATIDQLGSDLKRVLDQTAAEGPVVLVGHSMGGMSIMTLAEDHPEIFGDRVVGVALISTTAGGLRAHRSISTLLPDRLMSQITPRLVAALARAPGVVDGARRAGSDIGFVATSKLAFGDEVPTSYIEFVDQMLARTSFDVLAEFFPHFDGFDKFAVLEAFESVPTVIICGDHDLLTSIGHSRKMASRLPHARLVECPGAGHMVILERPKEVHAALEQLIDESMSGSPPEPA